ncbi:MAG: DUF2892 domain-containing protein [Devosia sp.]|nr:DUF2892 domain-containing protein [Devosia sp.]
MAASLRCEHIHRCHTPLRLWLISAIDPVVKVAIGLALLALFFVFPDAPWHWYTLIGPVPLVTGLLGTCPIYLALGRSTCPARQA